MCTNDAIGMDQAETMVYLLGSIFLILVRASYIRGGRIESTSFAEDTIDSCFTNYIENVGDISKIETLRTAADVIYSISREDTEIA